MPIFVNDIGTAIRLRVYGKDLSLGLNPRIYYKSPTGTQDYWDATLEDSITGVDEQGDNILVTDIIQRVIQAGDFFESGNWQIQGYIELPTWTGFSTIRTIKIDKDLST